MQFASPSNLSIVCVTVNAVVWNLSDLADSRRAAALSGKFSCKAVLCQYTVVWVPTGSLLGPYWDRCCQKFPYH